MSFKFKLPALGEGIMEGEIVSWSIKEGDTINEDDTLLEVQNDKSVEEIPSPVSGKVLKIVAPVGTVAVIGDVLVEIDAPGHEDEGSAAPAPATASAASTPAAPAASTGGLFQFKLLSNSQISKSEVIVRGLLVLNHDRLSQTPH